MNHRERSWILNTLANIQSHGRSPSQDVIDAINKKSLEIIAKL